MRFVGGVGEHWSWCSFISWTHTELHAECEIRLVFFLHHPKWISNYISASPEYLIITWLFISFISLSSSFTVSFSGFISFWLAVSLFLNHFFPIFVTFSLLILFFRLFRIVCYLFVCRSVCCIRIVLKPCCLSANLIIQCIFKGFVSEPPMR